MVIWLPIVYQKMNSDAIPEFKVQPRHSTELQSRKSRDKMEVNMKGRYLNVNELDNETNKMKITYIICL